MFIFKNPSLSNLCTRFLTLFADHGISQAQIPRFLPQLSLADLLSQDRLLAALTPQILDQSAQLFSINVGWLEGVPDVPIYPYHSTYKHPKTLLEHCAKIWQRSNWENQAGGPLRILATTTQLNSKSQDVQRLIPILLEPIVELGEETIFRYVIYQDGYDWGYSTTRIELKAIARAMLKALHIPVPIYKVTQKQIDLLYAGNLIPHSLLGFGVITNPSLEDYALSPKESGVSKESDELPAVLNYMAETGIASFQIAATPTKAPQRLPASNMPKEPGKRDATRAAWLKIEAAATALWASDPTLTIAAVSRRLQMIPGLGAKGGSVEAIRKRIRHLAPEGVRGKPGRKPKQSG